MSLKRKAIDLPKVKTKISKSERRRLGNLDRVLGSDSTKNLYYDLQTYRTLDWEEAVRAFEANPDDFFNAHRYLDLHPIFWRFYGPFENSDHPADHEMYLEHEFGTSAIEIAVVRVNPADGRISDDDALNTRTRVWLETGKRELHGDTKWHDPRLDVGADTYEKAIVKLAKKVHKHYGNDRRKAQDDRRPDGTNEAP